jgi:hypothetical protein
MAKNTERRGQFSGLTNKIEETIKNPPINTQEYTPTLTPTPVKKENRTKRLQLVFQPSIFKKLDDYARINNTSKNDIVHKLVEDFLDKEGYNG